jgi:hypothetical protein
MATLHMLVPVVPWYQYRCCRLNNRSIVGIFMEASREVSMGEKLRWL